MNKKQNIETIVGIVVIFFCLALIAILYTKNLINSGSNYYILNAAFERVDGIDIGSEVVISGVKVGQVKSITLDPSNYNAMAKIGVQKDLKLPIDTSAEILSANLMGEKYVALVPGAETELLRDGDTIEFTQSSVSIESLITKFVFGLDAKENNSDSN